jgi:hypothetical protein
MVTGDVNRLDGLADLVVAVDTGTSASCWCSRPTA